MTNEELLADLKKAMNDKGYNNAFVNQTITCRENGMYYYDIFISDGKGGGASFLKNNTLQNYKEAIKWIETLEVINENA